MLLLCFFPPLQTIIIVPATVILQRALCVWIMTDAGTGNGDADAPLKCLF